MKRIAWNLGKNSKLKEERGVSFEDAAIAIEAGRLIDVVKDHTGSHPGQMAFLISTKGKIWAVPFDEGRDSIYLETIMLYKPVGGRRK